MGSELNFNMGNRQTGKYVNKCRYLHVYFSTCVPVYLIYSFDTHDDSYIPHHLDLSNPRAFAGRLCHLGHLNVGELFESKSVCPISEYRMALPPCP